MPNFSDLFGGAVIKSIQRGVITIPAGSLTATATITSVNTAKSLLANLGSGASGPVSGDAGKVTLSSSTVITATVDSVNGGASRSVQWQLVEYY